MWNDLLKNNPDEKILSVKVPVYMFQGVHDYQTPFALAKRYFEAVESPEKYFFEFENSAHNLLYGESEKFIRLIRENVLGEKV